MPVVTDQDIQGYQRDGVACIRNAVSMEWVERLRPAADRVQADPGPYDSDMSSGLKDQFYCGQFMWWRDDTFRAFLRESGIAALVARLMQAAEVRLFYDFLLTKEPGAGNRTPWHQDRLYYPLAGEGADNICSVWIALDPVTLKSGAVEYVKGSHAWGKLYAPASFSEDSRYDGLEIDQIPDIERRRGDYDIVAWDLAPGDCVAHHVLNVHGAPDNTADIRRRGLAIRWIAGEATYDPRPGTQPLLRAALGDGPEKYRAGDQIGGDNFPLFRAG